MGRNLNPGGRGREPLGCVSAERKIRKLKRGGKKQTGYDNLEGTDFNPAIGMSLILLFPKAN
ncbi:hypothetical protein CBFG_03899 [Clostridiales bacterium 1_7_47FAA]|nr:hypothetical protein CBFG_03899 [Clostridiales bacterium 1_7_47FAA]